jgi:Chitobiase/beta-hexosaminidase C-terminal domain/F5/8 type C domain/S-layer homology domain
MTRMSSGARSLQPRPSRRLAGPFLRAVAAVAAVPVALVGLTAVGAAADTAPVPISAEVPAAPADQAADADPAVAVVAPVGAATVAGETPALPAEVQVTTASGATRAAAVTWDTGDLVFDRHYATVPVTGLVEGTLATTAYVEVVPADLAYFIDAGTAGLASTSYDAVAALEDGLLNETSDQAAAVGTWGYSATGLGGPRRPAPYVATDKSATGLYGLNGSTLPLTYTLTDLEPGTYTVTAGVDEWWSGPRTLRADASGAGLAAGTTVGQQVTVSGSSRTAMLSGTVTTTQDGDVTLSFRRTAGTEAPVVSWIAVARGEVAVDTTPIVVAAPTISLPTGVYESAQSVELATATPGAAIWFTTDGSTPSRTNGTRYTEPIAVTADASVAAVTVRNGLSSAVVTADYRIDVVPADGYTAPPIGRTWYDTNGDSIQAHGGGFLQHEGWFYWIGENKAHDRAVLNAVSLYRSQDLLNWEHVNDIVTTETAGVCDTGTYTGQECKIERPKLLFNAATQQFVMWGHWETADSYAASKVIVATSDTIDGDYEVQGIFRPGAGEVTTEHEDPTYEGTDGLWGYGSRDFTVFKDPDSDAAYLFSTEDHENMRVYRLTDDYTDVVLESSYRLFAGGHREAPAVVKIDGRYFVMTSGQSGWYPNQTRVGSTTDLSDPNGWSDLSLVGNNSSFYSQPTNIITVEGDGGERSYLYMGDRWNSKKLGTSTYVWLPLEIDGTDVSLTYQPGWSFDPTTAAITTPRVDLVSQGRPAAASSEVTPAGAANDGIVTNTNLSGDSTNYWQPDGAPASWQVDLGEARDLARVDLSWRSWNGSETRSTYSVHGSLDGITWDRIAQRESNRLVAFTTDDLTGTYRHVRVDISSVINDHNGNAAPWAAGLVEVQVYAEAGPEPISFVDVAEGDQFFTEISWLAQAGISTGWVSADGTREFRPVTPIARDAMAAFLYRLQGSPDVELPEVSPFSDVDPSNQFYEEIVWLAQEEISTGWVQADGTAQFRPLEPIARDAMAAFLHRLAGSPDVDAPATSPFADVAPDNQFYAEIAWLAQRGIATGWQGNDGTSIFQPLNPVNRDAMAAFLHRYEHPEVG